MPLAEMARYMNVSERTLQRYSNDRILSRDMTERLVPIARLFARGFEVFGDMEDLKEWMLTPNQAVGGKAPTSLLDTTMGIGVLTNILGRIEYGVYS
jgi:putative toxin-antitoxin system antitoxin component (TIGR02293 family)